MAVDDGKPVPTGKWSRAGRLGGVAGKMAGSALLSGIGQVLQGRAPEWRHLLLTPANIQRLTNELATMRGAAMKLGQLLSMDAGDFLPPALTQILSRLRDDAQHMPKQQVLDVLNRAWGEQWQSRLLYFSFAPIAAASIGQVHKAITYDGQQLAIKIQYPGVKDSIVQDVNNLGKLLTISGLLPSQLDIAPILRELQSQLEMEADYQREADMMMRYQSLVASLPFCICPHTVPEFCSDTVLAMSFLPGEPITWLEQHGSPEQRDKAMAQLLQVFFTELFDGRLLQSDPNLANFRYQPDTETLVLLDFGAAVEVSEHFAYQYKRLLQAAAQQNGSMMLDAAVQIGLVTTAHSPQQQQAVVDMGMTACEAIQHEGVYDFGESTLITRLQAMGMQLSYDLDFWHIPPHTALLIHRKLGGLFLLAKRLGARVNLAEVAAPWYDQ